MFSRWTEIDWDLSTRILFEQIELAVNQRVFSLSSIRSFPSQKIDRRQISSRVTENNESDLFILFSQLVDLHSASSDSSSDEFQLIEVPHQRPMDLNKPRRPSLVRLDSKSESTEPNKSQTIASSPSLFQKYFLRQFSPRSRPSSINVQVKSDKTRSNEIDVFLFLQVGRQFVNSDNAQRNDIVS